MALNTWTFWLMSICLLWSWGKILSKNWTDNKVVYFVKLNDTRLFITYNSTGFCNDSSELESMISIKTETFSWKVKKKIVRVDADGSLLFLSKWHTKKNLTICIEAVKQTNGNCTLCFNTNEVCNKSYDRDNCQKFAPSRHNFYYMNLTTSLECHNCNSPIKQAEIEEDLMGKIGNVSDKLPLDPQIADKVMSLFNTDYVNQFNASTVAMTMGKSITGVLVKQTDPKELDEVSLGYTKVNENFSILEDSSALSRFSRSVTVSKEAFMMAMSMNISEPFAAIFRFLNMSKDEYNSSVLDDEVIAVEMGAAIRNLTDTINLNFRNLNYKGIPSCRSWNGNGSQPTWSDDGCETLVTNVINVTCKCTHMTFFAVLLTPINETISSSDLNILTTITRVGCGISMFFLGIILFMHFIMRRARASNSTKILIHLVVAMFLLVFSFLVNDFVAQTKNVVGCTIMAASMHYFMLSTFTWFGVHAFHLSMQLHSQGKIHIQRYVLKVAVISWVLPSIVIIVLLSVGKYGEVTIQTENTATSPSICWILDNTAHYIVNIGYYALVFLFTFSTMVLILTWLYYMRKNQKAGMQGKNASSCQKIITITGLCCVLGVTWSCAFFAYGIFRVPALYCFTILNSFQGFCLFIYYYKTSHMVESKDPSSTSSTSTLKTNLDEIFNPYDNDGIKPKPE